MRQLSVESRHYGPSRNRARARRIPGDGADSLARNAMQYFILGPLEVRDARGAVPLSGTKQRALVALLVLHANRPVSAERLAQALWGDDAPARAVRRIHVHLSRLRKVLGADAIIT